nr:hypothetical protein [Bacteroides ovatus]
MTHRAFSLSCVLICLSLHIQPACAQDILKDANSVIVEARTEVLCKSMTQSIEKESLTITILNRKGLEAAHFFCGCDMFRSLQKFSGEIINADGQSVRKIKKSELQKSEYSSSLSTDDYFYFYECNYPSLPFTVKYEWEVKCKQRSDRLSPLYTAGRLQPRCGKSDLPDRTARRTRMQIS